jgi:hypothetical protein
MRRPVAVKLLIGCPRRVLNKFRRPGPDFGWWQDCDKRSQPSEPGRLPLTARLGVTDPVSAVSAVNAWALNTTLVATGAVLPPRLAAAARQVSDPAWVSAEYLDHRVKCSRSVRHRRMTELDRQCTAGCNFSAGSRRGCPHMIDAEPHIPAAKKYCKDPPTAPGTSRCSPVDSQSVSHAPPGR